MKRKYNNVKCEIDGIKFDSKKEGARYRDLVLLQKAGVISNLLLQQVFVLAPAVVLKERKKTALRYIADFTYFDNRKADNRFVVEDCKGVKTEAYHIKKHLMMHVHKIEVLET